MKPANSRTQAALGYLMAIAIGVAAAFIFTDCLLVRGYSCEATR
jgi:hypothetical protein